MSTLSITPQWQIPLDEFEFTYTRSSGPGGQNVNKVASRATLRWAAMASPSWPPGVRERFAEQFPTRLTNEGEVLISSQKFRDQDLNRTDCLEKLRELLVTVARPPKRRHKTKPTRGSKERRLRAKRDRSEVKNLRRTPPRGE